MGRAILTDRTILEILGPDRVTFLQSLVSNDVTQATGERGVWAALLSPRGRYKADFFVFGFEDRILLDVHDAHAAPLQTALRRYALRARVEITRFNGCVVAGWDGATMPGSVPDPRIAAAGWRRILSGDEAAPAFDDGASVADYEKHCHTLGLPVSADLQVDETLLLEANFDCLNGISWDKGCYIGQEVTARMRYRGGVRKRLIPIMAQGGPLPPPGAILMTEDGQEAGEMRSGQGMTGMALLRRQFWREPFKVSGLTLTPQPPAWFPAEEAESPATTA